MSKSKSVEPVEELPPPVVFKPAEVPDLSPAEIDAAIKDGGLQGVIKAVLAKLGTVPPDAHNATLGHAKSPSAKVVDQVLRGYRTGSGGQDQAEVLAYVARHCIGAQVLDVACQMVGEWIAANPGTIVPDANHTSGKRRIF